MTTLRGHPIAFHGAWQYCDTGEPTAGNRRSWCGHCGLSDTPEEHDGCLGALPGVMNACCGHGDEEEAYVQFWDGASLHGSEAVEWIESVRDSPPAVMRYPEAFERETG